MTIIIVDYRDPFSSNPDYSTNAHTISSILHNFGVSSIILRWNEPLPNYFNSILGVILTGGPEHVYNVGSPEMPSWLPFLDVPVFGICYGMQLIAKFFGGEVVPISQVERGPTYIKLQEADELLGQIDTELVWMNHHDIVRIVPANFQVTSVSSNGYISSITDGKQWWGVQFHPEICVNDCFYERVVFKNFINICILKAINN